MGLRENVEEVKNEVAQLKQDQEDSWAMMILKDYKKTNTRMFWIWIVTFLALIGVACYTVYLLNDISNVETKTIDIDDVDTIDNSHIKISDDVWEK